MVSIVIYYFKTFDNIYYFKTFDNNWFWEYSLLLDKHLDLTQPSQSHCWLTNLAENPWSETTQKAPVG